MLLKMIKNSHVIISRRVPSLCFGQCPPMLSTWNNFSIQLQKCVHRDRIQTRIAAVFTMVTLYIVFTLFCSSCASLHGSLWPTHPPGFVLFLSFLLSFSIALPLQPLTMFHHKIQFWPLATRCLIVLFTPFNLSLPCAFLPPPNIFISPP